MQRIGELEAERDALTVAIRRVLDEKETFVAKNRRRLRAEARKARREAVESLTSCISALERAREDVVTSVEAERWAAEYPGPEADASTLRLPLIRGGRLSKAIPDLRTQVAALQVVELLRSDADWLDRANADEEDDDEMNPDKHAIWEQTDEGREAIRRKNKEVREGLAPRNVREAGWG